MIYFFIIPEDEMTNEYIKESYCELYSKIPTIDELAAYINNLNAYKINLEDGTQENFYILSYKTMFPKAFNNYTRMTKEEVKEFINTNSTIEGQ
jgi:hypothetical protein